MKYLVTGGLGFIGLNYILNNKGDDITVLDNETYAANSPDMLPTDVKFIHGNICSINKLDIDTDFDWIIHFAAESHVDNALADATAFWETNVKGTYELTVFALKHGIKFYHVSTDEVFGEWKAGNPKFTETSKYKPNNMYSVSKAASDQIVRAQHRSRGLEYIISNCGNNYGEYQHKEKFMPRLRAGAVKLHGKGIVRDWVHVMDHATAIDHLIANVINDSFVIGSGDEHTLEEVCDMFGQPYSYDEQRPGVDVGYSIDPSKLFNTGWTPKYRLKDYLNEQ